MDTVHPHAVVTLVVTASKSLNLPYPFYFQLFSSNTLPCIQKKDIKISGYQDSRWKGRLLYISFKCTARRHDFFSYFTLATERSLGTYGSI